MHSEKTKFTFEKYTSAIFAIFANFEFKIFNSNE